ncbi:MAG: peptide-methionine (R)-S-oxide reductase MsrB [Hyphomicrobiaceae bacterium]
MIDRRQLGAGGVATLLAAFGISKVSNMAYSADNQTKTFEITKTKQEWREQLSPQQFYVLREHGTEWAHSSPLDKVYDPGTYHCAGCELALFSSETKFDSRTGWPSFWKPLENAVGTSVDDSLFATRTEVHCRRCGGHLGHVFPDGPKPTGLRYCMNGIAMTFVPTAKTKKETG